MEHGTTQDCGKTLAEAVQRHYPGLCLLARHLLRRPSAGDELDPTELVHEAYLRLVDQNQVVWEDRAAFFRAARTAMRRVLINHRIARARVKRGGEHCRCSIDLDALSVYGARIERFALCEILRRLGVCDPRASRIIQLRYWDGRTTEETARVLGICARTVERECRWAKDWLRQELQEGEDPTGGYDLPGARSGWSTL